MCQYKEVVLELLGQFQRWELQQISRTENAEADLLSRLTQGLEDYLEYVSRIAQVIDVDSPSIKKGEVLAILPTEDEWMTELILYKTHRVTPVDLIRKKKMLAMASSYRLIEGRLFKKSFSGPLLQCVTRAEANRVMEENHGGICAAYQGARTLARKVVFQRYYWPRIVADSM